VFRTVNIFNELQLGEEGLNEFGRLTILVVIRSQELFEIDELEFVFAPNFNQHF
jgi:hypothetical protein